MLSSEANIENTKIKTGHLSSREWQFLEGGVQALSKLNGRKSRKIGNNTYLQERNAETIAVKLHETDIVTYKNNNDIWF
jgi:replicative DNA helicase